MGVKLLPKRYQKHETGLQNRIVENHAAGMAFVLPLIDVERIVCSAFLGFPLASGTAEEVENDWKTALDNFC